MRPLNPDPASSPPQHQKKNRTQQKKRTKVIFRNINKVLVFYSEIKTIKSVRMFFKRKTFFKETFMIFLTFGSIRKFG